MGGVGGAAVLVGLAIVAWRIWGRNKDDKDDSDDLVGTAYGHSYGNSTDNNEKTTTPLNSTPFQSTLESYHAPQNVNASSNF